LVAGTEHGDDQPADTAPTPPAIQRGPEAFDTERTVWPSPGSYLITF
jgi:hypothetical protein